jgi:hypothetical protein
LTSAQE